MAARRGRGAGSTIPAVVSEQLLTILKLCLIVLLYLFFLRVLRAVWTEVRAPRAVEARRPRERAPRRASAGAPSSLLVIEPPELAGRGFPLAEEVTVGRAAGCHITLDDTYASQIHARVFTRDGQWMVEDLGSTNGTYVNREKVAGPTILRRGDQLQVGGTVLELT